MKMYGDSDEFSEQLAETKKEWLKLRRTAYTRNYLNSVVLFSVKMMSSKILTSVQVLLHSTRIVILENLLQDQRDGDEFKMMKMISQHLLRLHSQMGYTACL